MQFCFPIYLLAAVILLFQGLIISGSPVNSAVNFYLLKVNETTVGYTGICTPDQVCFQTTGSAATPSLTKSMLLPESTLAELLALQNSLSYTLPTTASVALGIGLIMITLQNTRAKILAAYTNLISFCALGVFWISTIMAFCAAYSVQVTISALIATSKVSQPIARGGLVHTFLWLIFAFTLLLTIIAQAIEFPKILQGIRKHSNDCENGRVRAAQGSSGQDNSSQRHKPPAYANNEDQSPAPEPVMGCEPCQPKYKGKENSESPPVYEGASVIRNNSVMVETKSSTGNEHEGHDAKAHSKNSNDKHDSLWNEKASIKPVSIDNRESVKSAPDDASSEESDEESESDVPEEEEKKKDGDKNRDDEAGVSRKDGKKIDDENWDAKAKGSKKNDDKVTSSNEEW